jgi:hypothetical protein
MNTGQKALAFALAAFLVVGAVTVAGAAGTDAGTPTGDTDDEAQDQEEPKKLTADESFSLQLGGEFVDDGRVDEEGYGYSISVETEGSEDGAVHVYGGENDAIDVTDVGAREDDYDGDADYYHVPVGAVDDGYDHDFDPSEVPSTEFAGAMGYVVEAEKVDTDDPRVVAHVAENDPEIDGIVQADEVETRTLNVDGKTCRENDAGDRVCELSLSDDGASE